MFKAITIAIFLFLFYRLIVNSGTFLGTSKKKENSGDFIEYEEVDSKLKK